MRCAVEVACMIVRGTWALKPLPSAGTLGVGACERAVVVAMAPGRSRPSARGAGHEEWTRGFRGGLCEHEEQPAVTIREGRRCASFPQGWNVRSSPPSGSCAVLPRTQEGSQAGPPCRGPDPPLRGAPSTTRPQRTKVRFTASVFTGFMGSGTRDEIRDALDAALEAP